MANATTITEVGPFVHEDDPDRRFYRRCDFCDHSAIDDAILSERPIAEWRRFAWLEPDGLSVCENCLPEVDLS